MAGALVRKARLAYGWTQPELAARMHVRQAAISKLKGGASATRLAELVDELAALGPELEVARGGKSECKDIFLMRQAAFAEDQIWLAIDCKIVAAANPRHRPDLFGSGFAAPEPRAARGVWGNRNYSRRR